MTKHICIIGASSAIGEELGYHYLNKQDWKITAVSRSPTYLLGGATRTPGAVTEGKLRLIEEVDLAKEYDCARLHSIRGLDLLVTLSSKVENARLDKMDGWQWRSVIDATLTSVANALRHCLPNMNEGGSIVVVGSIVGSLGGHGCANYAAAKAGLEGLVRAAANENPQLRINLLELGYTEVGMGARLTDDLKDKIKRTIPMKRFAKLGEVVQAIDLVSQMPYCTGNKFTVAGGL